MEAFVSLLNGLPGHSLGLLIALNQYLSFSILLAAPVGVVREGGFLAQDISGGQLLLIAFLLCHTICLLELSGHN